MAEAVVHVTTEADGHADNESAWERMLRLDVVAQAGHRVAEICGSEVVVERDSKRRESGLRFKTVEPEPSVAVIGDFKVWVEWAKVRVRRPSPKEIPFPFTRSGKLVIYGARPRSIGTGRLKKAERAEFKVMRRRLQRDGVYARRPRIWADCKDSTAPCPFVSCRHHLYLEVDPQTRTIKLNFPGKEVDELEETCSLRKAADGSIDGGFSGSGQTLERTGELLNLTLERARQVQVVALEKVRETGVFDGDDREDSAR